MGTTAVIVGTGIAGTSAALRLRSSGFDGRVLLIGDEPHEPYRRPPLSKDLLSGSTPAERIRLRPRETWEKQEIELRTSSRVASVDTDAKSLSLADGEQLRYDQLLLATGGRPRMLPQAVCATGLDGVHTLRTMSDIPALQAALTPGSSVLVIGAGLIGAEVAATARGLGCPVMMLEAAEQPLSRLLPPQISQVYAGLHREHGVDLHTGVQIASLERIDLGLLATDAEGRKWLADAVVVAVGMTPSTELAEAAGLEVDNGIVVDEYFRTSAPEVFAAGDVANQPNLLLGGRHRVEHWTSAQEQGTAVARSMLGEREPYGKVPWCWSDQYGVNLQVTGWPSASDDVTVRGSLDDLDFTAIFHRAGRLVGAVGVNRPKEVRTLRKLIAEDPYAELSSTLT
jgi:3-phenylpropionate/trans-cinnamate dioxygenase ferredoxin reductase subunit